MGNNIVTLIQMKLTNKIKLLKYKSYAGCATNYTWNEESDRIATGATTTVFHALYKNSNKRVAVKRVPPQYITPDVVANVYEEASILNQVSQIPDNSCFVTFREAFVDKKGGLCLVTEYIPGTKLIHITDKYPNGVPEYIAKDYIRQILEAIGKLHENNIAHLDLKLENILINSETNKIVIIDFGFSQNTVKYDYIDGNMVEVPLTKFRGTPEYCSPELVLGVPYDGEKADMWAIGVLTFTLLFSRFPFQGNNMTETFESILKNNPTFGSCSSAAESFIKSLFSETASRRLNWQWALCHPWFCSRPSYQLP